MLYINIQQINVSTRTWIFSTKVHDSLSINLSSDNVTQLDIFKFQNVDSSAWNKTSEVPLQIWKNKSRVNNSIFRNLCWTFNKWDFSFVNRNQTSN